MALAQDEDGDRQPAGSALTRSLELLETVAAAAEAPTVAELCHKLSLPKPTAHRLCQRLEAEGYLAREPGGRRFAAGPRLLRMGLDALRSGIGADRRAVLEEVVREIGETCNFTTLVGHEVVYLERVEARWPLRMHLEPGSRVPLHCTASGKLFLAAMTPARRARMLDAIDLAAFTPSTITDRTALETELARIRKQGFSEDREEFLLGLVAISAPVVGRDGATLAAVACHGPSARFDLDDARRHLPTLRAAAGKLAATLLG
ncbi:IclR family transcriptional regulator [Hansschlegelia zhihuaiae]|uniref:IclR family transcriptional regulator n=1 Tax=Hansschlegelia zhihuaiae TaxID=405005 RepID=A0A4Q0MKV8_9HYPH|nr:IclR family transcriptional regulator [Hansschlegelia zhihuaiae]RXF74268.1 IclR family transcriptional regulator [Hansschlegelia zhihuaiae]